MKTIKPGQLNIAYVWSGFKEPFGEPKVKPKKFEPKFITLPKDMLDKEILEEYKPEEITLDEFAYLLETKERMLTNGNANIFYIRDTEGTLWAVRACWYAEDGGWSLGTYSVGDPYGWDAGRRVVSRNLTLKPPKPSPKASSLEFRIEKLEEQMENIISWINNPLKRE